MSIATKIAIQLNCKMGGDVWAVEIPVSIFQGQFILDFMSGNRNFVYYFWQNKKYICEL